MIDIDGIVATLRAIDPEAWRLLGKGILDCDELDRRDLITRLDAEATADRARLDQVLAEMDAIVGRDLRVRFFGEAS